MSTEHAGPVMTGLSRIDAPALGRFGSGRGSRGAIAGAGLLQPSASNPVRKRFDSSPAITSFGCANDVMPVPPKHFRN